MNVHSIHDLAAATRGRRRDLGLSQAELATKAGVSRKWLNEFEAAKSTAELGLVLRVLDALGLGIALELTSDGPTTGAVDLDELLEEYQTRDE